MEPDYISKVGVFPIPYMYLFFCILFFVFFLHVYCIIFLTSILLYSFLFLLQMPPDILRHIPMNVVKEDGDVAFFRLMCWIFHGVVCEASFRKDSRFAWLDSKLFNCIIFIFLQVDSFFLFYTTHCV